MFELGLGSLFAGGGLLLYLTCFTEDENGIARRHKSRTGTLMSTCSFTYKKPEEREIKYV